MLGILAWIPFPSYMLIGGIVAVVIAGLARVFRD
jgi:hypothetical protein